jgi:hypothetical protein
MLFQRKWQRKGKIVIENINGLISDHNKPLYYVRFNWNLKSSSQKAASGRKYWHITRDRDLIMFCDFDLPHIAPHSLPVDCANTAELWHEKTGSACLAVISQRRERPVREVGFLTETQTRHHRNGHQDHYRFTRLPW